MFREGEIKGGETLLKKSDNIITITSGRKNFLDS